MMMMMIHPRKFNSFKNMSGLFNLRTESQQPGGRGGKADRNKNLESS